MIYLQLKAVLDISNLANEKLEGWLDDNEIENSFEENQDQNNENNFRTYRNINNDEIEDELPYSREYNRSNIFIENEEDPWV